MNAELRHVRCRWVIAVWAVSLVLAIVATLVIEKQIIALPGFWESTVLMYISYGLIAFGLYLACRSHSIPLRRVIGPIPPVSHVFAYSLTAIPVFLSSIGGAWMITLVAPHMFDFLLEYAQKSRPTTVFQALLTFTMMVVVAPAVEEFTFRGLIFTRLSVKYSYRTALIVSSLMFGLAHADFIGAFIFGVVAATLYSRSRSLMPPFALHSLNNAIAFVGLVASSDTNEAIPHWLGLTGVFIGIPVCAYLAVRWTRMEMSEQVA